MSVSLVSRNVARKLLFIQFLAVIASGLLFLPQRPLLGHLRSMWGIGISGTA